MWNTVFLPWTGEGDEVGSFFFYLLTVARSRVLDLQQHPLGAGGLFHCAFAGVGGVVASAHRLVRPALGTRAFALRAASSAHAGVPQTLLAAAALDVLA